MNNPELIRLARKVNYEISEGFRDADLPFEFPMSDELTARVQAAAMILARASGVSIQAASVVIAQDAIRQHLARLDEQRSN